MDTKNTEDEASSRHEGESSLSDLSERYDDNDDDDDDGIVAKDNNCYEDGDSTGGGGVDKSTGARGGSAEWMGFLSLSALSETFGAMAKAKASSSTKSRKSEVGKK